MNKGVFIICMLMLLQNVYSQQTAFFDLVPEHTQRKLKEYSQSPLVYGVAEKQFKFIAQGSKTRVANKEYKELDLQITSVKKDSVLREDQYQLKLNKFSQVTKIKVLIDEFLGSTKPYELKKDKLISAQKIAKANGVNELIYADNIINKALKTKFFILQLNTIDLKVHLKKITWRLAQMDLVSLVRKPSTLIDRRLKDLRTRKSSLMRYNYITSKPKTIIKNGLVTTTKLGDAGLMKGQFKQLGVYYIVQNDYKLMFKKGQLLDSKTVSKYTLASKGYVGSEQVLIQNVKTKVKCITQSNFLNRYAFSINGKYNKGNFDTAFAGSNN